MNKHQLCCIGHITLDKVVTPQNTVYMPGGTAFYCSHAIRHFNDIDYALVTAVGATEISQKGLIAVDSQGYLREVRDTHVYPVDWTDKREALQYIHFLKVNEHEMEVLTGLSDPHEAARQLYEWGVKEVLVTLGGMGSLIFDGKDFYRIPAYKPREVVDATGCGDTYTIGYLYQRVSGAGIEEAGRFAAAMSTLKIEKSGPFNGSKEDVIQCMTTAEQMF